jgi:hypothetical protein
MAKFFLQALQKGSYQMLDRYALDSLHRQKLIGRLTIAWNADRAIAQVNKNTKAAQDDFNKLLQDNTIAWADVKYEHAEIENFEYYPTLDIYIGNLTLWAGIKGHKLHISFDECLYFDNRWWMVCGDIRLVE